MRSVRWFGIGLAALGLVLVGGELFARFGLGLGDPPLSVTHPEIEYLFKPGQDVRRFGNRVSINAYGMRSADFSETKPEEQFRVLVFGDSVLNGGNLSDQSELATERLQDQLAVELGRDVAVGNVSAGSWGPGNWLGYARSFGFFEADAVILLISSHDYRDNPTFVPLNPQTHPQMRPVAALWEALTRYAPRYLPSLSTGGGFASPEPDDASLAAAAAQGLDDLREFLTEAQRVADHVVVIQFLERGELEEGPSEGYFRIREVVKELGIARISSEPYFGNAVASGIQPYRDNIHINADGQTVLAEVLWDVLRPRVILQRDLPTGERMSQ